METLVDYLRDLQVDEQLTAVLHDLAEGIKEISRVVKYADTGKVGTTNAYGEEQVAMDVLSDEILVGLMRENQFVGLVASEEQDGEIEVEGGDFAVCFDPLDGSSLVDVNLAVGTIVGIYRADSFVGLTGDEQLASLVAVYGPRTTILLTVRRGVVEFTLDEEGNFVITNDALKVGEGKMFAPGNLRATKYRKDYLELVNYWMENQYTLRYSGGMVPDVNQIILKGKGIFVYPGYEDQPNGKLRLLVECAPIALLMEEAGGAATDGRMRILEKKIEDIEQRTPIIVGSKEEVARCEEYLG